MLNFKFADFVSRLHVASSKFLVTTVVFYSVLNLRFLVFLTNESIIEGFRVLNEEILVFLKYNPLTRLMLFRNIKLISTPGHRQYWSLLKLSKKYNYSNFSGFFIISTNKGLLSSADALLNFRVGGEVFLKLKI